MNSRGNNVRRNPRQRARKATVKNQLLTAPLTWHLVKKRNTDPPPRQENPIWQRIIRLEFNNTTANKVVTHKEISDSDTLGIFRYMSIERIDVYTDPGPQLLVVSYVPDPNGTTVRIDRTFKDEGILGSTRNAISIVLPPQMRYPMHHAATNAVALVNAHSNVVFDFHVKLWRGGTTPAVLLPAITTLHISNERPDPNDTIAVRGRSGGLFC